MLNYEVAPQLLEPYVPAGTELDRHDGTCYASVVAFQFFNTRILGIPVPFHRDFSELNLRFYVRRTADRQIRRAVVFIREVVPRAAIALTARLLYNEPYITLPMRSQTNPTVGAVFHRWRLGGRWHSVGTGRSGDAVAPLPGSHEEFITDHAWGYTAQRDGGTVEYRVEHERWPVRRASGLEIDADFQALYGSALGAALTAPATAFVVDGSPVTVGRPVRLR
jgi:hypothetical protein